MTTAVRTTPPAHWESVGRMTLAASALILGGASACYNAGGWVGLVAVNVLAIVAWAVVWPEKASQFAYPAAHWHALAAASSAVATAFVVSVFVGKPLTFAIFVGGIAVAATFLLAVAPREQHAKSH